MLEAALLIVVVCIGLSMLVVHGLTGVPTLSSSIRERQDAIAMLRRAELRPGAIIYELGAGWGAVLVDLAAAFPDADIRGIELSPFPYCVAWLRARRLPNVSVRFGDFRRLPLADADAVVCYLMPAATARLVAVLDGALRPGTAVVSNVFWFRDRQPLASQGSAALYVWSSGTAPG